MSRPLLEKIQSAARQRQAVWASGEPDPVGIATRTDRLDELYAERRRSVARARYGTSAVIIKRARIEQELEKLMKADL